MVNKMFEQIFSYEALLMAWKKTQRLKRYRQDVIMFRRSLDENLIIIQNELIWKTYKVSGYHNYIIYEPKKRLISSLPLRDRVVQHALVGVIEPIIDKYFIYDSHACRKGHGVKLAVDRFIHNSKSSKYCLKCDISSYFFSINHDILMDLYRKKIFCKDTLWLIETVIRSVDNPGLPIGNLLSQLSANLYLHELDRYLKHDLKIKKYIRYMDDFVVFGDDYNELNNIKTLIINFVRDNLALTLSDRKSKILETRKGVEFCGFRCYPTHCTVKKDTRLRNRKRLLQLSEGLKSGEVSPEEFINSISSILGHSMYSRNYSYRKMLNDYLSENTGGKDVL